MPGSFRKRIGVLVLAGALLPVILVAVPSAQAATVCDSGNPCLPQNLGFTSSITNGSAAAFACANTSYCLYGSSTGGNGVYGVSTTNSNSVGGVYGINTTGRISVGVRGVSNSGLGGYFTAPGTDGVGVAGNGSSIGVSAIGGHGIVANGTTSYGVDATSFSTAADAAGVKGRITSHADYSSGVRGENFDAECCGFGVVGFHAGEGIGIGGYAPNGFGVFGWSPNNWAAYFDGAVEVVHDLHVNGVLYKGAGAFRIDNPVDPAHSYLQHSFVESPDMKNVYDGNVTTNAKGYATVTLPKWFQALNKDFRYQLTSLSGLQEVAVAKEIHDNRFTIQSQKPHSKVSWQVTGVRHDPYANAHRIRTVVPKTGSASGRYEHPELYGQPQSKSVAAALGPPRRMPKLHASALPSQK